MRGVQNIRFFLNCVRHFRLGSFRQLIAAPEILLGSRLAIEIQLSCQQQNYSCRDRTPASALCNKNSLSKFLLFVSSFPFLLESNCIPQNPPAHSFAKVQRINNYLKSIYWISLFVEQLKTMEYSAVKNEFKNEFLNSTS